MVELMIAMFLSTVILMGAFHVHSTFQYSLHRQDEITKIQQTMKVTRDLLDRRLRAAGSGLIGTSVAWCGGEHQVGPTSLHNSNTFGVWDTTEGGVDNDPDWIEIMSADRNMNGYLTKDHPLTGVVKEVDKPENFVVGGLIGIRGPTGVCIFMVRDVKNGKLDYGTGGSDLTKCYNDKQTCRFEILGYNALPAGTEILNFSSGTFALRVDSSNPRRPLLMMAQGVAGGDPAMYQWQPIAEHVEDMQIGVFLDTSTPPDPIGDVWVNSRDLTNDELTRVRAIRISLVFRSASEIPGWRAGRRPALEDRPAATTTDGYLRRVMTTTVKLRNMM
jgi:hypothetical protein